MQRILMLTDDLVQSGSFWRSGGPISELLREHPERFSVTWVPPEKVANGALSWAEFRFHHWVYLHRPCLPFQVGVVQRAKELGLKVWVDYDDNLFCIPIDNETHATYHNPNVLGAIDFILKSADVVSTSTLHLKRVLTNVRKIDDVLYCPNSIPVKTWWGPWRENAKVNAAKDTINILWRGSRHHQKDLLHMRNAIVNISHKYDNLKFHFVGFAPWHIFSEVDNIFDTKLKESIPIEVRPPNEVTTYFKNILATKPDILLVPLADNDFNKSKSNIAWIEGAWAGAHAIAPDWDEWRRPGITNYRPNDPGSFELMFDQVMEKLRDKQLSTGWDYIAENYSLEVTNEIRRLRFEGNKSHAISKSNDLIAKHYQIK